MENIALELLGEVRRTVAGARHHIDHGHADLEVDLVLKGTGNLTLGDHNYTLKPGVLIWLMPGQRHHLVRKPGLEMWVANFRSELLEPERTKQLAEHPLCQLPSHELIDLDRLLSQVAQDSDDPAVYNAGIVYLARRAWRASIESPAAQARPIHPAVGRALPLLRESGAALSLSELAEAAGIAAPYLSRLLVEHTGHSFVDWRNHIRIDRFMHGYRPGANLLDAALEAGFGSYARFNHIFHEMIGCAPSEWIKQTHDHDVTDMPLENYGMPASPTFSKRQSWTAVLPLVAPGISEVVGSDFIDRLLAARTDTEEPAPQRFEPLASDLTVPERDRLVATLRRRDPEGTEIFARLIDQHDFAGTYARLFEVFSLRPDRLVDAIAAFLIALSVAVNRSSDPLTAEFQAVIRQTQTALARTLARLDRRTAQEVHTALICHIVVLYRAIEAVRASGDPHDFDLLHEAASRCGQEAFGADIGKIELQGRGFVRRPRSPPPNRRPGRHRP